MSSAKKWTREEELKLSETTNEFKENGLSKEEAFKLLAIEFGRSKMAVSRKYYDLFPKNDSKKPKKVSVLPTDYRNVVDAQTQIVGELKKINNKRLVGRKAKFLWTDEKIEILKKEILKKEKQKLNIEQFNYELVKRLKISRATVFNKLRDLKLITKSSTWLELYKKLNSGYSLDDLNSNPPNKTKKTKIITRKKDNETLVAGNNGGNVKKQNKTYKSKNESKNHSTQQVVDNTFLLQDKVETIAADQNMVDAKEQKLSIWQKLNPFYRIRRLEQEIKKLNSNKQS